MLDLLSDLDTMFIVVASLSLTILTGTVAIVLPDRFCGPLLSTMALAQLGLGGGMIFHARSTLDQPAGDIRYALLMFLAAPFIVGGVSTAVMRIAARLFARHDRRLKPWPAGQGFTPS